MTDSTDTLIRDDAPESIWLGPACESQSDEGRVWSFEPRDCDEEGCGLKSIEYIRADLVERKSPVKDLPSEREIAQAVCCHGSPCNLPGPDCRCDGYLPEARAVLSLLSSGQQPSDR